MDPLIGAHLLSLGLWGGLVSVEIVFELQMFRGRLDPLDVADLHRITDRFLELPILALVMATGWMLWQRNDYSDELLPKVLFGLGAVLANVVCYIVVELRASTATRIRLEKQTAKAYPNTSRLRQLSTVLAATIVLGLMSAAVALYLGGLLIGWW
jgi:hypothetical protein